MSDDPLDPLDVDLDLGTPAAPEVPRDSPPRKNWALEILGLAAGLLALFIGYCPRPNTPNAGVPAAQPKADVSRGRDPFIISVLPPLDETDALVRKLVGQLSSNPTVATWLTTDGLILNFALVTRLVSDGEKPTNELRAMGRVPSYNVRTSRGNLYVDPATYRRYDRYALAISSLDARGTAQLYTTLKPRIRDAYRRMGEPTGDFDPVLERAIVELLKVPVVQGEPELAPTGIVYGYVDPRLEGMSDAQKHLLRMGPKNVQMIQEKLREIADYLGIPGVRLPRPSTLTLT